MCICLTKRVFLFVFREYPPALGTAIAQLIEQAREEPRQPAMSVLPVDEEDEAHGLLDEKQGRLFFNWLAGNQRNLLKSENGPCP